MNFYQRSLTVEAWVYPLAVYIGSPYIDSIIYGTDTIPLSGRLPVHVDDAAKRKELWCFLC